MKAIQSDVQTFLEGLKQFVLPLYQRRYSWTTRHWLTLAHDLERLMREPSRRSHFIGSFVTAPLDHAADQSVSRYRLIDGQQRLTTLLLLLAALRDVAADAGRTDLADEVHGLYLSNQYKKGEAAKKLVPTADDQADFISALGRPASPAGRIGEAYEFFASRLRVLPADRLDEARNAALGRLTVVSITLETDDDPHLIFESLNAKGERLTQADLLRNYFLMRLPQAEADVHFARLWQPMQQDLGDDLTGFFRHYLMRDADGAEVRKDEVYTHVKDQVDRQASTSRDVAGTLEEIRRHASHYARLVAPSRFEPDADTADRISRLHHLKSTTSYPFLLNVIEAVAGGRLSADALPRTLDLIEAFLIRRLVCGVPTNQLRVIFRGLCRDAAGATDTSAFLAAVRAALSHKQRCPNDVAFRDAIVRRPLYGGSKRDAARYLLERIERAFGHKEAADPSAGNVQVEHVMPQTLTDAWRVELSSREPLAADESHAQWLHTLGNLTLTAYNPELGNQAYAAKKQRLADSNFRLNGYFASADRWDANAIEARGSRLAERAVTLWPDVGAGLRDGQAGVVATLRKRARTPAPTAVVVDGKRLPVGSMLDAAHRVFEAMYLLDPRRFERAVKVALPKRRRGDTAAGMRTPRPVGSTFVDLHGSAPALQQRCWKLVEAMGLPSSTLAFESPKLPPVTMV